MTGLRSALTFLTVLPVPAPYGDRMMPPSAIRWFPVVGLLLGLALSLAAAVLFAVAPPLVAGVLLLVIWVGVTGALHLDGLADCADATLAALPHDRRLAILQDPTHGTFGVVSIALLLLLKVVLLASLAAVEAAAAVLIVLMAARASVVPAMRFAPPLRPGGMGAAVRTGATLPAVGFGMGLLVVASLLAFGWSGLAIVAVAFAATAGVTIWLRLRLGGLNGDGYGSVIEVTEAASLLAIVLLAWNGHISVQEALLPWA